MEQKLFRDLSKSIKEAGEIQKGKIKPSRVFTHNTVKRKITKRQEEIFRTCHQDFEGLSQVEAAKKLNINQSTILRALRQVEKVFPDMFPILTKLEAQVYHYYMDEGWSVIEIAGHMDKRISTIYKTLYRAKDKGAFFTDAKGRTLSYEPSMDANVKHQF